MRILIVGNGPAAVSAVEAIRQRDKSAAITVIAAEYARPYTPCFLGKYVAGSVGWAELAVRPEGFYEGHGVEVLAGTRAVSIDAEAHEVALEDGARVGYDRLLIACGAEPIIPDIPDVAGPGAATLRDLADAQKIRDLLPRVRHAVVLGSGFVALEAAEALAEVGVDVSVVVRTEQILRRLFDPQVSGIAEQHMAEHGVRFLKSRDLTGVVRDGEGSSVSGVELTGGERVPCELLVLATGMRPATQIAQTAGVAVGRGVLTDAVMRTSVPDIWAAGDVAEPEIAGVRKVNLIHPNAVLTGRIAGSSMAGFDRSMSNHFNDMNVLTLFGKSFLSIGRLGEGGALIRDDAGDLLKIFAEEGVVRGVQIVGNVSRGGLYAALLGRRLPDGVGERLLAPDFNFGDIETWPFAN